MLNLSRCTNLKNQGVGNLDLHMENSNMVVEDRSVIIENQKIVVGNPHMVVENTDMFVETMMMATLSILLGYLLLIPMLLFLTQVGFVLPEPMEMGGVPFLHLKGGVNALVLTAPALIIYAFAAVVTILPGIRAISITPKIAMSSY